MMPLPAAASAAVAEADVAEVLCKLFVSACAGKPIVICLDNVHFLDALSWKVLLR